MWYEDHCDNRLVKLLSCWQYQLCQWQFQIAKTYFAILRAQSNNSSNYCGTFCWHPIDPWGLQGSTSAEFCGKQYLQIEQRTLTYTFTLQLLSTVESHKFWRTKWTLRQYRIILPWLPPKIMGPQIHISYFLYCIVIIMQNKTYRTKCAFVYNV